VPVPHAHRKIAW